MSSTYVGSYQAKTDLSGLLEKVYADRQEFVITRHGTPIAKLSPVAENDKLAVDEAVAQLKAFSKGRRLSGMTIKDMVNEGRK